jgi:hypothetical protein
MTIRLVSSEIKRFLSCSDPELLCIIGQWGVGKTFAWRKFLAEAEVEKKISLQKYAYVSLFGLNSLEDLRYSIFQNTVSFGDFSNGPNARTFSNLVKKSAFSEFVKPLINSAASKIGLGGIGEAVLKSAFFSVREQIVCFDDLERAGKGLDIRDVLGLASQLKEERKCKVVFLLNEEKIRDGDRGEFNAHLEKVADVSIVFSLNSEEAVGIALQDESNIAKSIRNKIVSLRINNIRVIKKIERLAKNLHTIVKDFDEAIIEQSISTLVLGYWGVIQPTIAPSIDFIIKYNAVSRKIDQNQSDIDPDMQRWSEVLTGYPFVMADSLDLTILSGCKAGYFDEELVRREANILQERVRRNAEGSPFSKAWKEIYHGSLVSDDAEFLDALYEGAVKDIKYIDTGNLNSAVKVLREFGRDIQASDLIKIYMNENSDQEKDFYDLDRHSFFHQDEMDDEFRAAFDARLDQISQEKTFEEILQEMISNGYWDDLDIEFMSRQSVDDFVSEFEKLRGENVKKSVAILLRMARQVSARSPKILENITEALRVIGRKSPMRERKIRGFGVLLEDKAADQDLG